MNMAKKQKKNKKKKTTEEALDLSSCQSGRIKVQQKQNAKRKTVSSTLRCRFERKLSSSLCFHKTFRVIFSQ